jgi:hypothetical protein
MDIHKPRPWHGWREFAKEVGTIVLGVLIAIGAEQGVEALHHRDIVRHGEEDLRDNFSRFVEYKAALDQEAPCMAARVAELRAIIDEAAVKRRLPRVGPIPQPYPRPWQIDTWDAMVSSQAATYLPKERGVLYSRIAMSARDLYQDATAEWTEWGALRSLSGSPRPFGETEAAKTRETLARASSQAELVRFIATHTVERIQGTRLIGREAFDSAVNRGTSTDTNAPMCQPIAVGEP